MTMNYRHEIDGLRALAVLAVILCHCKVSFISGGYIGVDIFFVISGFLITSMLIDQIKTGHFDVKNFYERRCRRIVPPLVFMTTVITIVVWMQYLTPDFQNYGSSLTAVAGLVANIFFWTNSGYFEPAAETMPLLHTWSLAIEEQFYLLFPFVLYLFSVKFTSKMLFWLITVATAMSFMFSLWSVYYYPSATFYLLPTRSWELLCGALVALAPYRQHVISMIPTLICDFFIFLLLIPPIIFYDSSTLFPGLAALPTCLGAGLFIYINKDKRRNSCIKFFLSTRPLVGIGKISYALYLWHWPILSIANYNAIKPLSAPTIMVCLVITFVASIFSWLYIEQPIRQKKIFPSKNVLFKWTACSMLFLMGAGIAVTSLESRSGLISVQAARYAAAATDIDKSSMLCHHFYSETVSDSLITGCLIPKLSQTTTAILVENNMITDWRPSAHLDFIVWGDSHAAAWKPAIDDLAKQYDLKGLQLTGSGVIPLLDIRLVHRMNADPTFIVKAQKFTENVVAIVKKYRPKHIVLAANWPVYFEGAPDIPDAPPSLSDTNALKSRREAREIFARQLKYTVDIFEAMGVTVWIVEPVPVYKFNVPAYMAHEYLDGSADPTIGQTVLEHHKMIEYFRKSIPQVVSKRQLLITPPICDNTVCFIGTKQDSFYSDSNHLNVFGALYFKDTFRPMFEKMSKKN